MTANKVFNDTVHYLSKYNLEAVIEIAALEFGIVAEDGVTKDELIEQCALVETENYVR